MQGDWSKFFLFMVLALVVLVIVSDQRRPLASAPIDPDSGAGQQTADDRSMITSAQFANVPSACNVNACDVNVPPLNLMMPRTGVQPLHE